MAVLLFRKPKPMVLLLVAAAICTFFIIFQIVRRTWSVEIELEEVMAVIIQGDLSYFYFASLEAFRQFEEGLQFYPLNFIRQLAFLPIPDEYTFGLKQRDLPVLFESAYHYNRTVREGNFPPGLFGVFVLNFGAFGPLIGPFLYFIFIQKVDSGFRNRGIVSETFMTIAFLLVLQLFRGSMMGFYYWLFLIIALYCIYHYITFLRRLTFTPRIRRG